MTRHKTAQLISGEGNRSARRGRVVPVLSPLLVLCLITATFVTPTAVTPVRSTAYPWCSRNPAVPAHAYTVEEFVRSHNGSPPRGYAGGRVFRNDRLTLPPWFGPFREYDLRARVPGQDREGERLVLGSQANAAWYTPDHYETFLEMHPWGCLPVLS